MHNHIGFINLIDSSWDTFLITAHLLEDRCSIHDLSICILTIQQWVIFLIRLKVQIFARVLVNHLWLTTILSRSSYAALLLESLKDIIIRLCRCTLKLRGVHLTHKSLVNNVTQLTWLHLLTYNYLSHTTNRDILFVSITKFFTGRLLEYNISRVNLRLSSIVWLSPIILMIT